MRVLFAGGGTMGPVTPLLAVAEAWRGLDPDVEFVWVGTRGGPEGKAVREVNIKFLYIPVARFPRYLTWEWLLLPFRLVGAFVMAFLILGRERPDVVGTAGGFSGVPMVIAAFFRRIPSWIHQPDARPLLSNRIAAPFADLVTVGFETTKHAFGPRKTRVTGNPVRPSVLAGAKDRAAKEFELDLRHPTVLVTGGGSGSAWLNDMMLECGQSIASHANVIHLTGRGKMHRRFKTFGKRYHAAEFLTGSMADALAAADVVVSRAGMGAVSELSALGKPAILVPLPSAHQIANARALQDHGAAIVLPQSLTTVGDFKQAVIGLVEDKDRQREMSARIRDVLRTDCAEEIAMHVRALGE